MRHVRRRGATLLASLTVAAASLSLTPSPAGAAECPNGLSTCLVVKVVKTVDGNTTRLNTYVLAPDDITNLSTATDDETGLNARRYALRKNPKSKNGKLDRNIAIARGDRVSLHGLLESLDPELVGKATFTETPNPDLGNVPAVLDDVDLVDPSEPGDEDYPFDELLPPAVFRSASGKVGYIRPLRDSDEDVNYGDYIRTTGRLDLTIHTTGRLLQPTVTSSGGTSIKTKVRNTYTVSFAKSPGTGIASTRWKLGNGDARGSKAATTYTRPGTYQVVATVRGRDGSYGRSAPLEIKVDKPPKAPKSSAGGGTGAGGGGGFGGGGGGGYVPPYDPGVVDPPADDLPEEEFLEDEPVDDVPVDDGLEDVEGYVLAGAEIVPGGTPEAIPGTQDSSAPAPASQESLRKRVATWVIAAFLVALLVGAGAASETRWFRTRLRHLRRRA